MKLNSIQRTAIKEVLHQVLSQVRPAERFLVDTVFDRQVNVHKRSEALGFGGDVKVAVCLFPLYATLQQIAQTSSKDFAKIWGEPLTNWLRTKPEATCSPAVFSAVRNSLNMAVLSEGVDAETSERLSNALQELIVSKPQLVRQLVRWD
jgi:hypothetical protein